MRISFLISGFFIIVFFLADSLGYNQYIHPQKWIILSFFFILSFLFHRLMEAGMKNKGENFVTFYLSTTVLRLILSLAFIGIELYFNVPKAFLFVINFFVLYLFYTFFELWNLSRNLRQNS
jgi:hypothetical protein